MTFGRFLFLKFLNKVCGFLDLKWFLNECCVENEASKEGSPESGEFLEFRATGEMILDRNVHFGYMKNPLLCQPKCYLAIKYIILTYGPFIVVCSPLSCNGDCKAGGGDGKWGLLFCSPVGIRYYKFRMMCGGVEGWCKNPAITVH